MADEFHPDFPGIPKSRLRFAEIIVTNGKLTKATLESFHEDGCTLPDNHLGDCDNYDTTEYLSESH